LTFCSQDKLGPPHQEEWAQGQPGNWLNECRALVQALLSQLRDFVGSVALLDWAVMNVCGTSGTRWDTSVSALAAWGGNLEVLKVVRAPYWIPPMGGAR
jgi:hypothetical protein